MTELSGMQGNSMSLSPAAGLPSWNLRLEQSIRLVLFLFIASLPFRQLLVVERNSFIVLVVLLITWSFVNKRLWLHQTPIDTPLLCFVLWVALSVPFASFPAYSVKELGKLVQHVIVFYAVVGFLRSERHQSGLLYLLIAAVALVSAYGLYQFDPANYQAARSFLPSEVWLTTFLVMLLPLCWALALFAEKSGLRALFGVSGLLATAGLLMTQSRAGLIALLIEVWLLAALSRKRAAWLAAGTISVLLLVGALAVSSGDRTALGGSPELHSTIPIRTSTRSIEHRFEIWNFALAELAKHPVVGIGYGGETLRLLYPPEKETLKRGELPVRNVGTHNLFLYLALHVGIPGLLLFLWMIGVLLKELIQEYGRAPGFPSNGILLGVATGTVGLLVRLQFDQMLVGTLAILFWVLVGLAVLNVSTRGEPGRPCVATR